ncbi:MAG TPA: SpoIIE family protein phosphatase, partial [Vicingus sp.]|nr:SpoIIE family protein phosphatase [Vicingus sp.]
TDAGEILNKLREKIIKALEQKGVDTQQKDGMDLALCVWDKKTETLSYSGANNPLWIIRNAPPSLPEGAELLELKPDKQPVGLFYGELKPFTVQQFALQKGDVIYSFSDGYADQFGGEKGKKFKYKAFKELLLSIQNENMEAQKNILNDAFEKWKGNLEQVDDICVIGVKV